MMPGPGNKTRRKLLTVGVVLVALLALHNQRLTLTDPENTYPKRLKRALRLLFNPADTELEKHLVGKGIACPNATELYRRAAAATVVIQTGGGTGAGVFVGPDLIVTAKHVVQGGKVEVILPRLREDNLAEPGNSLPVRRVLPIPGLDLAFVQVRGNYAHWLPLATRVGEDPELMIVGHPNRKYYALQKARIRKKSLAERTPFLVFKDNEIFFGNSGGAIVDCEGRLAGVVSMMTHYENSLRKRGIGINARTIEETARRLGLSLASFSGEGPPSPRWG